MTPKKQLVRCVRADRWGREGVVFNESPDSPQMTPLRWAVAARVDIHKSEGDWYKIGDYLWNCQ